MSSLLRLQLCVLFLSLMVLGSCDDDNPSNPGNGGNSDGASQFQTQIAAVNDQYITANAEAYSSLDVLGSYIAASLGAPAAAPAAGAGSSSISCFAAVGGTTYVFNGATYEAGPAIGAPDNAVRFVLYRINGNQPVLSDSIGFIEVRCTVTGPSSKSVGISMVANGVTPVEVNGTVTENSGIGSHLLTGFLAATGAPLLPLDLVGQYSPEATSYSTTLLLPNLQINAFTADTLQTGARLTGTLAFYLQDPVWNISIRAHGDMVTETLSRGVLYYSDVNSGGLDRIMACLTGGTLSAPEFSAPSASCDEFGYEVGPGFSAAGLAAISTGYRLLHSMHVVLTDLARHASGFPAGTSP